MVWKAIEWGASGRQLVVSHQSCRVPREGRAPGLLISDHVMGLRRPADPKAACHVCDQIIKCCTPAIVCTQSHPRCTCSPSHARDPDGTYWLLPPSVARRDTSLDTVIRNIRARRHERPKWSPTAFRYLASVHTASQLFFETTRRLYLARLS